MTHPDLRTTALSGVAVAVAAAAAVAVAPTLDLEPVAVLPGVAFGAALVLAAERSSLIRLAGFAVGAGAAVLGAAARLEVLPESTAGAAVAAIVVILLCTAVDVGILGRLQLSAVLMGAGAFAAVEAVAGYQLAGADPSRGSLLLSLLVTAAAGFTAASVLVGAIAGPSSVAAEGSTPSSTDDDAPSLSLEEITR